MWERKVNQIEQIQTEHDERLLKHWSSLSKTPKQLYSQRVAQVVLSCPVTSASQFWETVLILSKPYNNYNLGVLTQSKHTASILSVNSVLHQKKTFSVCQNQLISYIYANFLLSLLILFKFYFYLMSIDSFFKRSNKVIDDNPTPECSPHPSESLGSTTVIPATQVTPLQRQQQTQELVDNSLLSGHKPFC